VAVQQARTAAANLVRRLQGRSPHVFRYRHRGDIVSLGYHDAVGEIAGLQLAGPLVWFLWRTVFLGKLIGLKNRVRVALDWTIASLAERDTSALDWS
jgi:NADH dehydrogenase